MLMNRIALSFVPGLFLPIYMEATNEGSADRQGAQTFFRGGRRPGVTDRCCGVARPYGRGTTVRNLSDPGAASGLLDVDADSRRGRGGVMNGRRRAGGWLTGVVMAVVATAGG